MTDITKTGIILSPKNNCLQSILSEV